MREWDRLKEEEEEEVAEEASRSMGIPRALQERKSPVTNGTNPCWSPVNQ
jgi:hypothetical protein